MAAFSQTRNAVVRWVLRVVLALGSRDIPRLGVEVFIVGRRAVGQVSRRVTVNKSTVNKSTVKKSTVNKCCITASSSSTAFGPREMELVPPLNVV